MCPFVLRLLLLYPYPLRLPHQYQTIAFVTVMEFLMIWVNKHISHRKMTIQPDESNHAKTENIICGIYCTTDVIEAINNTINFPADFLQP